MESDQPRLVVGQFLACRLVVFCRCPPNHRQNDLVVLIHILFFHQNIQSLCRQILLGKHGADVLVEGVGKLLSFSGPLNRQGNVVCQRQKHIPADVLKSLLRLVDDFPRHFQKHRIHAVYRLQSGTGVSPGLRRIGRSSLNLGKPFPGLFSETGSVSQENHFPAFVHVKSQHPIIIQHLDHPIHVFPPQSDSQISSAASSRASA